MSKKITTDELATYLNNYLNPINIDEPAYNGLQIANVGTITKIATGVSISIEL